MKKDIKYFRKTLNSVSNNPIEVLTEFIGLCSDLEDEQIVHALKIQRTAILEKEIKAAKTVIEHTEYDSELVHLVLWTANVPITEPLAEQAKAWLNEKILLAESVLKERK